MVRERNEIEALKAHWRRDPNWDIEETEGFEEHREELLAYREETKAKWAERDKKHHERLGNMICPLMTISEEAYGHCAVEQCAWWNDVLEKCGVVVESYLKGVQVSREER